MPITVRAPRAATCILLLASSAVAQAPPSSPTSPAPVAQAPVPSPPPAAASPAPIVYARVLEGTAIHVHLAEALSSASTSVGDRFEIISDDPIVLSDGTVAPPGYAGRGDVIGVERPSMLGKSGGLSVMIDDLRIGGVHVRLRAAKSKQGASGTGDAAVATFLFGVAGVFVRGHSAVWPKGTQFTAFVDRDTDLPLPIPKPPPL